MANLFNPFWKHLRLWFLELGTCGHNRYTNIVMNHTFPPKKEHISVLRITLISSGLFSDAVSCSVCSMWISQMFKSSCVQGHQKWLLLTSSDCDFFAKSWSFSSELQDQWIQSFEEGHNVTSGWNQKPWKVWYSSAGLKQK